ncbi:hypothetical protein GQ43DRAFT_19675 [Delitschia confertaspora ATCC 74209]|uniref:Uncharacterized protein n=1 Tax=Delitschia confertaspora ATCC 74209 TaxID=1513339 RepID=A0A9P4JM37_9PLEO|nr:hypothetical protein GQ43DRAFT_19675 [Delitschia confertaspora ATCC 74209]
MHGSVQQPRRRDTAPGEELIPSSSFLLKKQGLDCMEQGQVNRNILGALRGLQTSFNLLLQLPQMGLVTEVRKLIEVGRSAFADMAQRMHSLRSSHPDIDVPRINILIR